MFISRHEIPPSIPPGFESVADLPLDIDQSRPTSEQVCIHLAFVRSQWEFPFVRHLARMGIPWFIAYDWEKKTRHRDGAKILKPRLLMPNWVFFSGNSDTKMSVYECGWNGRLKLTTVGTKRQPRLKNELVKLGADIVSGKIVTTRDLRIGGIVDVIDGPFKNFKAQVEGFNHDGTVRVETKFMGRITSVGIPREYLEAI